MSRNKKYRRSKKGIITTIYSHQKENSKKRNHNPPEYTKVQFSQWVLSQPLFHTLYENWKKKEYSREYTPSIDRKDDFKGYSFDNIEIVTCYENIKKGATDRREGVGTQGLRCKRVKKLDACGNFIESFRSSREASRQTSLYQSNISRCCRGVMKTTGGFRWEFA